MSSLAIMQPYFFPYLGYWQLIHAVDAFILLDEVQYIRHGWVNRNRVLKHGGGWQYITVPLRGHGLKETMKNIHTNDAERWKDKILRQLEHYGYKKKAPFYNDVVNLLKVIFAKISSGNMTRINETIINEICCYLDITTLIKVSSDLHLDYSMVQDAGEWALMIATQMEADEYVNPIAGAGLFDTSKFLARDIKLSFLNSHDVRYTQGTTIFEPSLSVIDVLMFKGQAGTKDLLDKYQIQPAN